MGAFLFLGDDAWSRREKLNLWKREFEKKYGGDMNITTLDGRQTNANEIFQACSAVPFLSEKRLTIVKDFLSEASDKEQLALAGLLEQIPDFCVLVMSESAPPDRRTILYKKLRKIGKLMEFPRMTGTSLLSWIERHVTIQGGEIDREAILILSEISNGDLFRLENEISKLVAYANGRPITRADIELLTEREFSTSIFRLTDGIGQKNVKFCLDTLHNLIDNGEELHGILAMIMRQFRLITCIKDLADKGLRRDAITAKLKEHPFVVSNTLSQVQNFSKPQLVRAYGLLVAIDAKLKGGGIKVLAGDNREFMLALDRLVLELSL